MGSRSIEIASKFNKYDKIVAAEVGVRFGKNAEQLLEMLPNMTIYLIDRWEKPPIGDSFYNSGDGIADRPAGHLKKALQETIRRTERFGNRVKIIQDTSIRAACKFGKEFFDFVFIDADHSYEGCRNDILSWLPKVKIGGYLCGHDYNHPKIGEVKKAVDKYLDNVELGSDMTWFHRREK